MFEISYYENFISPKLYQELKGSLTSAFEIPGITQLGEASGLETKKALQFLIELYKRQLPSLKKLLETRRIDRELIDSEAMRCKAENEKSNTTIDSPNYATSIGLRDPSGRIVFGPLGDHYSKEGGKAIATLPDYLKGPHVTLFGPPDSAKMSINAMNAYHRKLYGEPPIIEEILSDSSITPKWGADDEDSKTPLREDLVDAAVNLKGCFTKEISFSTEQKSYTLADSHLSHPIKRIPGLAIPCTFLYYEENPIPLHLYDFALHLFHHADIPEALSLYIPKLECEEEAAYIKEMIDTAAELLAEAYPSFKKENVRLFIVLENPRAILRTHEIINALYPHFAGASLGWHDFLASTARLFKEDPNYRIPVKADPDIVIKHIKASHELLADVVGSRGGVKIGGMYGFLPMENSFESDSFQITMLGYIKDVVTQLRRDLSGFWVAHPDFVRIGIALVEAWKSHAAGDSTKLRELVSGLLREEYLEEANAFIFEKDIPSLNKGSPEYVRSLIVANIKESDFIANNHPDEIRYNVFQCLQYLTDWLTGNGCVALPADVRGIPVRVMDDLATTERSRWEVWAELYHRRFDLHEFLKIAHEELTFIRKDLSSGKKLVQVHWDWRTAKWYPVAFQTMLKLMTDSNPVEFASELLLPFTINSIRESHAPLQHLQAIDPEHLRLQDEVATFNKLFEACGSRGFVEAMQAAGTISAETVAASIRSFTLDQINEAAFFHGDIGEAAKTLDHLAQDEQAKVLDSEEQVQQQLRELGDDYKKQFGMKFLISAKGKTAPEILKALKQRLNNSAEQEIANAHSALTEITVKRLNLSA